MNKIESVFLRLAAEGGGKKEPDPTKPDPDRKGVPMPANDPNKRGSGGTKGPDVV